MTPKYKTVKALMAAFDSGELNRREWTLQLDNNALHLSWRGKTPKDAGPGFETDRYEEGMSLFYVDSGVEPLAVELFKLLGIPAEWC